MEVEAIKPGYHGKLREPGEVFEVPDGSKASWYQPVKHMGEPSDEQKDEGSSDEQKDEGSSDEQKDEGSSDEQKGKPSGGRSGKGKPSGQQATKEPAGDAKQE